MIAISVEGMSSSAGASESSIKVSSDSAQKTTRTDLHRGLASVSHKAEWDKYWIDEDTAKHQKGPSVALRELLETHRWLLPKGRCLVAGCGNGHDAIYLAKRGVNCVAIDFCEAAIAKSHKMLEKVSTAELIGKATFAVQDFFTYKPPLRFTLAYEYGLFSAIPPTMRQQWAEQYARVIVPQGMLIVLLCPLIHRGSAPPYQVTMAECEHYLKRYFVLVRVDPNCQCIEGQEGNELMSVWRRA